MFNLSEGVQVQTVEEALKYLGDKQKPAADSGNDSTKQEPAEATVDVPTSPNSFFAVTIGINQYKYNHPKYLPNLNGCVGDADAMRDYLISLEVPDTNIHNLRDEGATRTKIIDAFKDLATDKRINKGDPIVIFFAGHGVEARAPEEWNNDRAPIQMRTTYNFNWDTSPEMEEQGIPDITLAALLNDIAAAKGNNITVIFDSCHSGSGTRAPGSENTVGTVRSAILPDNYEMLPGIDSDLRHKARAAISPDTGDAVGLYSHVLLAAASPQSYSFEGPKPGSRGKFTVGLLDLFNSVPLDTLIYSDVPDRLPHMEGTDPYGRLITQYPQVEGYYQTRTIFNGRAPISSKQLYRVTKDSGTFTIACGEVQGITSGAKFNLYEQKSITSSLFGTATIRGTPRACTSILNTPVLPNGKQATRSTVPVTLWAMLTSLGENVPKVPIAVPADDAFLPLIKRVVGDMGARKPTQPTVTLVDLDKPHELALRKDPSSDNVYFDLTDAQVNLFGVKTLSSRYTIPITEVDRLLLVLDRATDFFFHFRRSSKNAVIQNLVDLAAYSLSIQTIKSSSVEAQDVWLPELPVTNLNEGGIMTVDVAEKKSYGFCLTNNAPDPLFVWAFLFEISNLSISLVYEPPKSKAITHEGASLQPKGGELTIGYGSGGAKRRGFIITDEDADVEVSYFKAFMTTQPVQLGGIVQGSPFPDPNGRVGVVVEDPPRDLWGSVMLAVKAVRG